MRNCWRVDWEGDKRLKIILKNGPSKCTSFLDVASDFKNNSFLIKCELVENRLESKKILYNLECLSINFHFLLYKPLKNQYNDT